MNKNLFKNNKLIFCVLLISLVLTSLAGHFVLMRQKKERIADTTLISQSEAAKIQYAIESRIHNIITLEMLVSEHGGMLPNFKEVAAKLFVDDPSIRCLQLAENGVITHDTIYPLEGNESGAGNLFKNPIRKAEAIYSRDNKVMILAGPFELHQGGIGVVARNPIYITDEQGNESFWGFSIQVMDLERLLETAELVSMNDAGYKYQLYRYMPSTAEMQVFSGEKEPLDDAIKTHIPVPGTTWCLSVIPSDGWIPIESIVVVALIILLLNTLLAVFLMQYVRVKKHAQDNKTKAETDELTGLLNNTTLNRRLDSMINDNRRFSVFYIDVDNFKTFNDTLGHNIGDIILKNVGARIVNIMPEDSSVFRVGGDEFVVLLPEADAIACDSYKSALKSLSAQPVVIRGNSIYISMGCGYSVFPDDSRTADELLDIADTNMYIDKRDNSRDDHRLNSKREKFISLIENILKRTSADDTENDYYIFHADFTNFKSLNYNYGTRAGDELVERTIEYISRLPRCSVCLRGYADQFYFLACEEKNTPISLIEERFGEYLEEFFSSERENFKENVLSVWCGFAKIEDSIRDALGMANIGRVESKTKLVNHPYYIERDYATQYISSKIAEQRLLEAIKDDRVVFLLQPIVNIEKNALESMEVLGRIIAPDGSVLYPDAFVPILEKTHGILEFDILIIKKVCEYLKKLTDEGKPVVPVSINLSRRHVNNHGSIEKIQSIIADYGLNPSCFKFEITERVLVEEKSDVTAFCKKLIDMGAHVSIDDFGSGFTSFSLIQDVTIDEIKLDRSLLYIDDSMNFFYENVISSIVEIARKLNTQIVCEGIETKEQLDFVRRLGINIVQGYYFSKPGTPDEIYQKFSAFGQA